MKVPKKIERSGRMRFNQTRQSAAQLLDLMQRDYREVTDADVADMRSHVEDITQRFHEMNAYRNSAAAVAELP